MLLQPFFYLQGINAEPLTFSNQTYPFFDDSRRIIEDDDNQGGNYHTTGAIVSTKMHGASTIFFVFSDYVL